MPVSDSSDLLAYLLRYSKIKSANCPKERMKGEKAASLILIQ
jgi:hypothetical protein